MGAPPTLRSRRSWRAGPARVLDVGAGTGAFDAGRSRHGRGRDAVDSAPAMADLARTVGVDAVAAAARRFRCPMVPSTASSPTGCSTTLATATARSPRPPGAARRRSAGGGDVLRAQPRGAVGGARATTRRALMASPPRTARPSFGGGSARFKSGSVSLARFANRLHARRTRFGSPVDGDRSAGRVLHRSAWIRLATFRSPRDGLERRGDVAVARAQRRRRAVMTRGPSAACRSRVEQAELAWLCDADATPSLEEPDGRLGRPGRWAAAVRWGRHFEQCPATRPVRASTPSTVAVRASAPTRRKSSSAG